MIRDKVKAIRERLDIDMKMDNKEKMDTMKKAVYMELREHKSSFMVYVVLRVLVIIMAVLQFFNGNFENVFLCGLTLILLLIPSMIQIQLRIEFPTTLEIIILLFIFAAEILGEIQEYYIIFPFWDTMLHTLNGFLAAAIGFALVDILNREERIAFKLSPVFMAVVAFCFSMTIGVLWEFFECGMDLFLGFDMQKDTIVHSISSVMLDPAGGNKPTAIHNITQVLVNDQELGLGGYLDIGLLDTMKDLFVNFIGAVLFSIIGFFYIKRRGKGKFAKRFIPKRKKEEADFLTIVTEEKNAEARDASQNQGEKSETERSESKVKTIVFDIGNVLSQFCYEEHLKQFTEDETKYQKLLTATVMSPQWNELDRGVWTEQEIVDSFVKNDPSIEKEIRKMFAHMKGIMKEYDDSTEWILELKEKGYQVLVLSNFSDLILRTNRDQMKFLEVIDGGILSYREHVIKPDAGIYRLLMEQYDLKPEECIFLDDREENVQAAQAVGWNAIQFTDRKAAVEEMKKYGIR